MNAVKCGKRFCKMEKERNKVDNDSVIEAWLEFKFWTWTCDFGHIKKSVSNKTKIK